MTDTDALLLAVCRDPADDGPRLAYADALLERGDPRSVDRAMFVQYQIQAARMPDRCQRAFVNLQSQLTHQQYFLSRCRCEVCSVRRKAYNHAKRWVAGWGSEVINPLFDHYQGRGRYILTGEPGFAIANPMMGTAVSHWSRGFLSSLRIRHDTFLEWGRRIFRAAPITHVEFTNRTPGPLSPEVGARRWGFYVSNANDGLAHAIDGWFGLTNHPAVTARVRIDTDTGQSGEWVLFDSAEAATAAVSDVCCEWARAPLLASPQEPVAP